MMTSASSASQKIVQTSFACFATLSFIIISGCDGIKMKGLLAPKWVNTGESFRLLCDYDLGRDAMYSIKWFKDDTEVFRYIPTNQPLQYKSFQIPGIVVLEKASKPNNLVLSVTGAKGSGTYKCEVTIETPSFVTLAESTKVTVMTPPLTPPKIEGVADFYTPGDLVDINCTSLESKPAATLEWIINNQKAKQGTFLPTTTSLNQTSALETSMSNLRFVAETKHFPNGRMKLTCIAKIEQKWQEKTTKSLVGAGEEAPNQMLTSISVASHPFTLAIVPFTLSSFLLFH